MQQNNTMTPEREAELLDAAQHVIEELDIRGIASKNGGHYFIYMDCYEELSDYLVSKILTSNNPRGMLGDIVNEIEESYIPYHIDSIAAEIWGIIACIGTFTDKEYYYIANEAMDKVVFALDHEFFQQDVRLNIIADIEDANFDFGTVVVGPHIYAEELTELSEYHDTAWYWLARQQGYDDAAILAALANAEFGGSKFLKSLYREIMNCATGMGALTFLVKTTLEHAIELNEAINRSWKGGIYNGNDRLPTGTVAIPSHAAVGFLDTWHGSGGTFDIQLEKAVELPIQYVFGALPDGESGAYGVRNIYGVGDDWWNAVINVQVM